MSFEYFHAVDPGRARVFLRVEAPEPPTNRDDLPPLVAWLVGSAGGPGRPPKGLPNLTPVDSDPLDQAALPSTGPVLLAP